MSQTWPREKIRELLALADATGHSSAVLASAREAELFRFAIYSFRRKNADLGGDLSVTLEGNNVIIKKREEHYVAISQAASAGN